MFEDCGRKRQLEVLAGGWREATEEEGMEERGEDGLWGRVCEITKISGGIAGNSPNRIPIFLTAGAQQDVEMADTRLCISTSAGLKRWTNSSFLHNHLFSVKQNETNKAL